MTEDIETKDKIKCDLLIANNLKRLSEKQDVRKRERNIPRRTYILVAIVPLISSIVILVRLCLPVTIDSYNGMVIPLNYFLYLAIALFLIALFTVLSVIFFAPLSRAISGLIIAPISIVIIFFTSGIYTILMTSGYRYPDVLFESNNPLYTVILTASIILIFAAPLTRRKYPSNQVARHIFIIPILIYSIYIILLIRSYNLNDVDYRHFIVTFIYDWKFCPNGINSNYNLEFFLNLVYSILVLSVAAAAIIMMAIPFTTKLLNKRLFQLLSFSIIAAAISFYFYWLVALFEFVCQPNFLHHGLFILSSFSLIPIAIVSVSDIIFQMAFLSWNKKAKLELYRLQCISSQSKGSSVTKCC